jgi:hypothetical protein
MKTQAWKRRCGFTLVEVTIVSGLTAFLALLLSSTWYWTNSAGFPNDLIIRGRLLQEMDMAISSFSRDFGGSLAAPTSFSDIQQGRWIAWQTVGSADLSLCYDGGENPDGDPLWTGSPDTVIHYYLDADPDESLITKILVREDENTGVKFTVARYVDSMAVDSETISGSEFVTVELTFKRSIVNRDYTRKFTLKARAPQ